jgi:hypothetical protein
LAIWFGVAHSKKNATLTLSAACARLTPPIITAATLADTIFFVVFFILISLNDGKKLFCKDVAEK